MMMVLGLYVFMLRTVPYQELQYQRSWRHAANSRVNRRPSTQFLGPDNDMLTLSGVLMPEITGGRLSLLALEQMAEQGKAWPLIEGSGTIFGMYVIEGLNQTKPAKKESTTVKRKRRTKKQKKEPEAKQGDYLVGTDENVLVLNRTYANRSNAERAAKMQWERLQRGVASFSLQLAEGRADLYTEIPVKVSGFKQPIDDAEWTITTLTHTVSPDNGFTTSLELEVRIDDFEME